MIISFTEHDFTDPFKAGVIYAIFRWALFKLCIPISIKISWPANNILSIYLNHSYEKENISEHSCVL